MYSPQLLDSKALSLILDPLQLLLLVVLFHLVEVQISTLVVQAQQEYLLLVQILVLTQHSLQILDFHLIRLHLLIWGVMERQHPKSLIGKLGLLDEEKIDASESSVASKKRCLALCKYWSVPHAVFS